MVKAHGGAPELGDELDDLEKDPRDSRRSLEVYTAAAAFYVTCLKNGYPEEATEFAEWFLDEFDIDLET